MTDESGTDPRNRFQQSKEGLTIRKKASPDIRKACSVVVACCVEWRRIGLSGPLYQLETHRQHLRVKQETTNGTLLPRSASR